MTRTILTSTFREDATRVRQASEEELRFVIEKLEADVAGRIEGLASREDPYAGGTLLDLDTHSGVLPRWSRDRVRQAGGPLMRQLSLDLLYLLDHRLQVLDAPHYLPALGEKLPELGARARQSKGKPYFAMQAVLADDSIKRVLVVEAARQLEEGQYSVTVLGGRRIDASVFESLRKVEGVHLRIVGSDGRQIVPPLTPWEKGEGMFSYPLRDSGGQEIARVEMLVRNNSLPVLLEKVTVYSALLALAALAVTVLLGFLVARRMTRDLDELVVGVHAAARGDLDHQVAINSKDEIGEVVEAFNTMMIDLKISKERLVIAERVAAWQEIARRLAHEIKNPLTPIQMSMETLRKTFAKKHPSFDEVFEESTATVLEEAARLKRIVKEFSEFARMPKPSKSPLSINDLVRSQLALYQGSIEITKSLEDDLPLIDADKDTLSQLLLNLIENARDAVVGAEDARIQVSTQSSRGGAGVLLRVDDNGPGIPSDMKDKLFTPYFTTKHAHGGTGLGLAIAHRIVADHEGQISVGDSPLGGARFTVELPVREAGEDVLMASKSGSMGRAT